ncbi:hypothetical protein NN561_013101 [Cricetulus griseus]
MLDDSSGPGRGHRKARPPNCFQPLAVSSLAPPLIGRKLVHRGSALVRLALFDSLTSGSQAPGHLVFTGLVRPGQADGTGLVRLSVSEDALRRAEGAGAVEDGN